MKRSRTGVSLFLLVVRLVLAGLFLLSAWQKLRPLTELEKRGMAAPPVEEFARAIVKLDFLPPESVSFLAPYFAFVVPWLEAVCAVLLLLGLWTRAAALWTVGLYAAFLFILVPLTLQGEKFDCQCFGKLLQGMPPWGHVTMDLVLLVLAGLLFFFGGGIFSADRALDGPGKARDQD